MKKLLYINYICLFLLFMVTVTGFHHARLAYSKYGFAYSVTTIIDGEVTTKRVTLYENLLASGLTFVLFLVLLFDIIRLRATTKTTEDSL